MRFVLGFVFLSMVFFASEVHAVETPVKVEASYYAPWFDGRKMSNGQTFRNDNPHTAASRMFPLGTRIELCDPESEDEACLWVIITDRVSTKHRHRIDLTLAAGGYFDFLRKGTKVLEIRAVILPGV